MSLKRKRSLQSLTPHLPSPPLTSPVSHRSNSTRWSVSPQTSPSPPPSAFGKSMLGSLPPQQHNWDIPIGGDSHLDSRTKKRLRDNRPDEDQVYQSTLGRLFGAQQRGEAVYRSPLEQQQQTRIMNVDEEGRKPRQASLHSFWTIPRTSLAPMPTPPPRSSGHRLAAARCEDCDRSLADSNKDMNLGDFMDIDGGAEANASFTADVAELELQCSACQRLVCDMCAVHGDQRVCLGCARSKGSEGIWGRS